MADVIQLTLVLRQPQSSKDLSQQLLSGHFETGSVTSAELGADPADVEAVLEFLKLHDLQVVKVNGEARSIHVAGTPSQIAAAFGIDSADERVAGRRYRGAVQLPDSIKNIVIAVLGLDQTAIAVHH